MAAAGDAVRAGGTAGGEEAVTMTFGTLFTGIGAADLALERCGMACRWQVERDRHKVRVLERHWPAVPRHHDVRCFDGDPVDLVCGGDPCPSRSRARGDRPSRHPDLSGYFLAVVGRLRPRWVVRENVPAPDAVHFAACLELLGYRVVALAFDSRDFTGQSRRRDYLLGCPGGGAAAAVQRAVREHGRAERFSPTRNEEETPVAACLTAHGNRMAAEDTFLFEPGRGLRILSAEEAEALQGFPRGWTAGFPERRRRAMCGDAMTVDVVEWVGRRILEAEAS